MDYHAVSLSGGKDNEKKWQMESHLLKMRKSLSGRQPFTIL